MNSTRPLVFFILFCVILFEVWGGLEASEVVFEGGIEIFSLSACLSKQLELIERKATGWARQVRQQLVVNYEVSLLLRRFPPRCRMSQTSPVRPNHASPCGGKGDSWYIEMNFPVCSVMKLEQFVYDFLGSFKAYW